MMKTTLKNYSYTSNVYTVLKRKTTTKFVYFQYVPYHQNAFESSSMMNHRPMI